LTKKKKKKNEEKLFEKKEEATNEKGLAYFFSIAKEKGNTKRNESVLPSKKRETSASRFLCTPVTWAHQEKKLLNMADFLRQAGI
jgi:hypothetical protein